MRCASVFNGAGLFDEGMRRAGLKACVGYETDADACESANLNGFPVRQEAFTPLTRFPSGTQVVWGGPPCQSHSIAHTQSKPGYKGRQGLDDKNGRCTPNFVKAFVAARADILVIENVRGLRKHLLELARLAQDYTFLERPFSARSWLPVLRDRIFFLLVRSPLVVKAKQVLSDNPPPKATSKTLEDVIGMLRGQPHDVVQMTPPQAKLMPHVGEGGNWTDAPDSVLKATSLVPSLFHCSGCGYNYPTKNQRRCPDCGMARNLRSSYYRRLSWGGHARCLVTEPTCTSTFQAHPDEDRMLSVQEYKKLQGLPLSYALAGSVRSQYKQLGNGVPVPAAKWIGRIVMEILEG